MPARSTTYDYEQSSEGGRERHLRIPYSRQTDTTPTLHDPVEVTGLVPGSTLTGTNITLDATHSESIVNVAKGAVYRHGVRNVLTYTSGPLAEATWGPINVGDPVYYDAEQDSLSGNKLSTAPVQSDGATPNTLFGWVVLEEDQDTDDFPKGDDQEGAAFVLAICQA